MQKRIELSTDTFCHGSHTTLEMLLGLILYEAPNRQQNLYEVRCADIFTITDPN